MLLTLIRDPSTENSTPGTLYINGYFECFTLEDVIRETKVYGKTAIPKGEYKILIDWSPKYQREMLHVLDVPGFSGIRIHSGNKAEDTEGCILVGSTRDKDWIGKSRQAYTILFNKIEYAISNNEEVTLKIS